MSEELKTILRDSYVRERRLNLLYCALAEHHGTQESDDFFSKALRDQSSDLQVLEQINNRYGNNDVDPGMLDKIGEGITNLRAVRKDRAALLKQILEHETELVNIYKQSLRFLSNDDSTRKLVNKILTVKLGHRLELMDKLEMFIIPSESPEEANLPDR